MPRPEKVAEVARLAEMLEKSSLALFLDFRGLRAQEMMELRRQLGEQGVAFRVVKNTLSALALEKAKREEGKGLLLGPTAIAFGYGEEVALARLLSEALRPRRALQLRGGLLGDRVLKPGEVQALAALPPRDVLLAQVVGGIQSPLSRLLTLLQSPLAGLLMVLQGRAQQLVTKNS